MRNRCNLRAAGLVVCCATLAVVLSACGPAAQSADSTNIDLPPLALEKPIATQPDANQRVQEALDRIIPKIRFRGIQFEQALYFLRDTQKVNVNPDWIAMGIAGITKTTEIDLQLANVTFKTALRELLTKAACREGVLDYVIRDGIINVSTAEDLSSVKYIVIYDVRDLLARRERQDRAIAADMFKQALAFRQAFPTAYRAGEKPHDPEDHFTGFEETGENFKVTDYHREAVSDFLEVLRSSVLPDSWAPTGDAIMKEFSGRLVVKQTAFGHRELAKLLQQIRESFAASERAAPAKPWPGRLSVPWYKIPQPGTTGEPAKRELSGTRPD